MLYTFYFFMSFLFQSYVIVCDSYAICISSACDSNVLVCHQYVTRMYSYVIRMSLVCTRMSSVCHSYVLVCHPYVTRMYSYVIRMSLVCTRMSFVCHWDILVCHPHITRMWFCHVQSIYCNMKFVYFELIVKLH